MIIGSRADLKSVVPKGIGGSSPSPVVKFLSYNLINYIITKNAIIVWCDYRIFFICIKVRISAWAVKGRRRKTNKCLKFFNCGFGQLSFTFIFPFLYTSREKMKKGETLYEL